MYTEDCYYEVNILRNILKRCISNYREKFGDKTNCLFRKDDVLDDIIKYILYIFGNSLTRKFISN